MGIFKRKRCKQGHQLDPSWRYCPVCIAPIRGWLVEIHDDCVVRVETIHEGKTKIGSGFDCEIRINDTSLGRHHALLKVQNRECFISALGSEKPILVNNLEQLNYSLIDGDIISLGKLEFRIKLI